MPQRFWKRRAQVFDFRSKRATATFGATTGIGPLIDAPKSDSSTLYKTLSYLEAYDAVNNDDYAFVAYQETNRATGAWRVRVKSLQTAGGVFEPAAIAQQARAAGAQGLSYFVWGFQMEPSPGDVRCIEFRVHIEGGKPKQLELFVQLRRFDHSADLPNSIVCDWPTD